MEYLLINSTTNKVENIILLDHPQGYLPPVWFSMEANNDGYLIGDTYGHPKSSLIPSVEQQKQAIRDSIDSMEKTTMIQRVSREFMLVMMEKEATDAGYTLEQLYASNIGYRKLKDLDSQIRALRTQL